MTDRINPPKRLLCGPGPTNVSPSVLEALRAPLLSHVDPDFRWIMAQTRELLGRAYANETGCSFPLSATGNAGMQAGFENLLEPGDTAIVGVNGFFGERMAYMAGRAGVKVVRVEAPWGRQIPPEQVLSAVGAHPQAKLVALVHAETSTGVRQPIAEVGEQLRGREGTLLMVDCVTSLGGIELDVAGWGVDYAYSCSQKCLGSPPGLAPVTLSAKALRRVQARAEPPGFYLDLALLIRYWTEDGFYHHTTPVLNVYALHESLRLVLQESLPTRWRRHREAGLALQEGLAERGFELLAEEGFRLPQLTAVRVPAGVDAKEARQRLLLEHGIEIGGGLGELASSAWRIGLMADNASLQTVERILAALDDVARS